MFSDPPGPKIGNGGATLVALEALEQLYGSGLDARMLQLHAVMHTCRALCGCACLDKVLLIHAGGHSKRLPHVSVVGKIFATLPLGTQSHRERHTKRERSRESHRERGTHRQRMKEREKGECERQR